MCDTIQLMPMILLPVSLACRNCDVEDLRPETGVFKGAESKYDICFVSSYQVYELYHIWVVVKMLTVDQFNNIKKKMNPVQASLFSKSMGNDLASEFFLIELN